jgi:hypothetical protein
MALTVYCDLPLPASAAPVMALRGPWSAETAVENSPFTLSGQTYAAGSFTANVGTLEPGLYRASVTLSGTLIAIGYVLVVADATTTRLVDDPQLPLDPTDFATAIATAVSNQLVQALLARFTVSRSVGVDATQASQDVTRDERLLLGPLYTANFAGYVQSDVSLVIGVLPNAADVVGRLVWTAKPTVTGDDSTAVIKVDSASGLVKPTGGSIASSDGKVAAIANAVSGQPSRAASVDILARAMAGISPGRLYWDLRRYIAASGSTPAEADVLATGIIDLSRPVNQATS